MNVNSAYIKPVFENLNNTEIKKRIQNIYYISIK
jgi:hypothetical protein